MEPPTVGQWTNQPSRRGGGRLRFIYFDHLYGTFDHHRHVSSMYWYPIDTHLRLYRPIHLTICPRAQTQILRFFTSSMSEIRQHHARRLRIIIYGFLIGKMPPNKTKKINTFCAYIFRYIRCLLSSLPNATTISWLVELTMIVIKFISIYKLKYVATALSIVIVIQWFESSNRIFSAISVEHLFYCLPF